MKHSKRSGLTMIELIVSMTLLGLIFVKAIMLMRMSNETEGEQTSAMDLEDSTRRLMDRIAFAIMGSTRDRLFPDPESPVFSDSVEYVVSLGSVDGEVVWAEPERISLGDNGRQIEFATEVDTPEERRTIWTNIARPFLEGELPNGLDDNGNGLVDERGLTFTLDGDSVHIHLTMERPGPRGVMYTDTARRTVTIRN